MKFHHIVVLSFLATLLAPPILTAQTPKEEAAAIYELTGVRGGFVVHVGLSLIHISEPTRPY